MIRPLSQNDFEVIHEIINDAARAYEGVIPPDCWKEPYMPRTELEREIAEGVVFWGFELDGEVVGVMGTQHVRDVTLIRHAYVRTEHQSEGVGSRLLGRLREEIARPLLVGTWAAADWAIRFYEKHGFRLVSPDEKERLLRLYWSVPDRQIETSVVLADGSWFDRWSGALPHHEFSDVDEAGDPRTFVEYLDAVGRLPTFRAYKRRSFALLDVQIGDRILDVGCGTGADALELGHRVGPSGRVVGVDRSQAMIAAAAPRLEGLDLPVEYRTADAYELPFEDGAFDGCRIDRVLQHLDDPRRALGEAIRVVRPGGRLVASEPDWGTLVVPGTDRRSTRAIAQYGCDSIGSGWVGRELAPLFAGLSVRDLEVHPDVLVVDRLETADEVYCLGSFLRGAMELGLVAPAEGAAWRAYLEEMDSERRFFSALTIFTVAGRTRERLN